MLEGALAFVLLQGPSGIGKTYLADRFLAALPGGGDGTAPPLVLRGRCHERETVPYKAFDAIVDDLSRHLMELDEGDQTFVLPDDAQYLAEIFPVLRRLRLVADPRYDKPPLRDARELRNYAFVALRELLSRLGRLRPLVLFIDDLQWADHDSFALLEALIQQPGAPAMELLATCRPISPETGTSLAPRLERLQARGDAEVLELGPLPAPESRELAARLLDELFLDDTGEPEETREADETGDAESALRARITGSIAREAGGNPFFVAELVRSLADPKKGVPTTEPQILDSLRLDRLLMDRMRALSDESQQVLQAVAVAGDPLPQSVIAEAARMEIPSAAWDVSIAALADSRLVRQHGLRAPDPVEPYHDRVREAVVASLEPKHVRRLHERLAESIERWDPQRIDMLARHFMAADQPDEAKRYVREAAAQAQAKLAFERASTLYEAALELETDLEARPALLRALGDCLANAGRSGQAAEAYQRAAAVVEPAEADVLTHLAAAQYLRGGHIARGMEVMEGVLWSVGLRMASTTRGATLSVASRLGYLKLRGTRFRERPAAAIPERDRRRLDVLWSANVGLAVVDVVRSTDLLVRFVIKALEVGDRYRVAQGLALLGSQLAGMGPGYFDWARSYVNEADVLARRIEDPALRGLLWMSRCLVRYFEGDFSAVADELVEVEQHFLDRCHGVSWELAMTRSFMCWALRMSGRLRELSERFDQYSADAERTGDLYQVANLRTYQSLVWLARDDLPRARRDIEGVLGAWPRDMYQVQHLFHLYARCEQALYAEQPHEAWAHLRAEQRRVESSGLLRVSGLKLEFSRIRGRVHLGMAETLRGARRRPHLKEAHRCARILIHAEHQSAEAMGRFLEAGARWLTPGTPRDQARRALERAVATGEAAGTRLLTASAKHWLGKLRGGQQGRKLSAEAVEWMAEQGVRNPPRLAHMLVPGYRPQH